MRDLTPEECEFIAGGKLQKLQAMSYSGEGDIVVTASPPPPPYYPPPPYNPPSPPSPPPPPSSGGGGYASPGTTAANTFANNHIQFRGRAEDLDDWQRAHDDLAKLYDWATTHPNALVDIGNGISITGTEALSCMNHVQVIINSGSSPYGPAAAYSPENASRSGVDIQLYTASAEYNNYMKQPGTQGEDYLVFHEIGHAFNYFENRTVYNTQGTNNEAAADAAAHSLQSQMGIPEISR